MFKSKKLNFFKHKTFRLTDIPTMNIDTKLVPHVATSGSEMPAFLKVDVE